MKIKDIIEKILRKKLKITPLIMAFALVISSLSVSIPVYAFSIDNNVVEIGEKTEKVGFQFRSSHDSKYYTYTFYSYISSAEQPVYRLRLICKADNSKYIAFNDYYISRGNFEGTNYYHSYTSSSSYPNIGSGSQYSNNMVVEYDNVSGWYYGGKRTTWESSLVTDYIVPENCLVNLDITLLEYLRGVSESLDYAENVNENIENVLGVLMNPYTGGNDGDEWTFLWKWTPPNDSDLIMEIMADVEYVNNLGDSLLTAVKNSWSTASVSLYEYEDGLLGSNGHLRFTYDYMKEKLSEELGEDIGFFGKVRLKNIYFRYARFNEESNSVEYGDYTTFTPTYRSYMDTEPKVGTVTYPTGQFHSGVTESYDPKTGTIPETYIKVEDPSEGVDSADDLFGAVRSYLNSGKGFIGDFPVLMGDIFQNIPPQITALITIGLGLLIVLRLFGR